MRELRFAFSEDDIQRILEDIPQGMDALYGRALDLMSKTNRGKHIVKTVLLWTACAIRSLTLQELENAILLDTGERILSLDKFILSVCGQLVHVDKDSRVTLVHETVKAFLLHPDLQSEFAIQRSGRHGRIAEVCLKYLNSNEMRPPRSQKLIQLYRAKATKRPAITCYACLYFSQHLRRSHSNNTQPFLSLFKFLEGNVSTWIELMVSTGNLYGLILTARDFRGFLQARAQYHSPISKEVQRVSTWESDLVRLAARFGNNLSEVPSAIFWLVPPFCPSSSAIGSQFGLLPHGISVRGLASNEWTDRSCCVHYHGQQTRAVACADAVFAVGLSDKTIKLHSYATYEEVKQLRGKQPAKLLALSDSGKLLAASSVHYITMFNLETGELKWQIQSPQECLTLSFADHDKIIRVLSKGGILSSISVSRGIRLSYVALEKMPGKVPNDGFGRVFTCAAFSPELNMVAAAQRGGSIGLFDMEEGRFIGFCDRTANIKRGSTDFALSWVFDFVFSPNQAYSLLAALYHDSILALFDPSELTLVTQIEANAQILACNPDGRILATGDTLGTIEIFEFESLHLMHKMVASDDSIRSLVFSKDSLRIIGIRGGQCNIWEPPILVHVDTCDIDSVSDTVALEPSVVEVSCTHRDAVITALACHTTEEFVFCGKNNGDVEPYSTVSGSKVKSLYQHAKGIAIKLLEYGDRSNLLVSADASSRLMIWKVAKQDNAWAVEGPALEARISDYAIRQILLDADNKMLLVSTLKSDILYDIHSGAARTNTSMEKGSGRWIHHPHDSSKLIHTCGKAIHIHNWKEAFLTDVGELKFETDMDQGMAIKAVSAHVNSYMLSVELSKGSDQHPTSNVYFISTSSFNKPSTETIGSEPCFSRIATKIHHIIGDYGGRFLFLDRKMWVCSLSLQQYEGGYFRHCFVPNEWLRTNSNLLVEVNQKGDAIFSKDHEIAIIKRALENRVAVCQDVE